MVDGPVRLEKLKNGACRWPLDTASRDQLFCGKPGDGKSPYCELHHKRAVVVDQRRKKERERD